MNSEIQKVLDGDSEGCIICGDCLDVMADMPDGCVDAVVTDPPYGIGIDRAIAAVGGTQHGKAAAPKRMYVSTGWDDERPTQEAFNALRRVSSEQFLWGGNYFADLLPPSRSWVFWDKETGNNAFSDFEVAWSSHDKPARKVKWRWNGMLQEDMKNKDFRQHPTQKPVGLMIWVLENYTKPGDVILDAYMGSGTTCVAAKKLGRRWIGIELEEKYCQIARNRLRDTERPLFKM